MEVSFVNLFGFNFGITLFGFAAVVFSRRKERSITALRAVYVFLIGWLGGSVVIFFIHLLFGMTGPIGDNPIDAPLALLAMLPILYRSHTWLSQKRANNVARQAQSG